jgi:hypothetical protein
MTQLRIAILGERRTGKDSAGDFLVQHYGCRKISIAAPMKRGWYRGFDAVIAVAAATPELQHLVPSLSAMRDNKGLMRSPLQECGLGMREEDMELLVRSAIARYELETEHQATGFVVTDARFANEVDALRRCGFTIVRLISPRELQKARSEAAGEEWRDQDSLHPSEVEQRGIVADHLIENDTNDLHDLYTKLEALIHRYALPDTAAF